MQKKSTVLFLMFLLTGCVANSSQLKQSEKPAIDLNPSEAPLSALRVSEFFDTADVYFQRVDHDEVRVISAYTPSTPYQMYIYAEEEDGRLTSRHHNERGCIQVKEDDRKLVVFTILKSEEGGSRNEVYFKRIKEDEVLVLSYWTPSMPYKMYIYVEGEDGKLRLRDRDRRGYVTMQKNDHRIVVFTFTGQGVHGKLISRNVFDL